MQTVPSGEISQLLRAVQGLERSHPLRDRRIALRSRSPPAGVAQADAQERVRSQAVASTQPASPADRAGDARGEDDQDDRRGAGFVQGDGAVLHDADLSAARGGMSQGTADQARTADASAY